MMFGCFAPGPQNHSLDSIGMNPAASILVQMVRDTGRAIAIEWDIFLLARQLFLDRGW